MAKIISCEKPKRSPRGWTEGSVVIQMSHQDAKSLFGVDAIERGELNLMKLTREFEKYRTHIKKVREAYRHIESLGSILESHIDGIDFDKLNEEDIPAEG